MRDTTHVSGKFEKINTTKLDLAKSNILTQNCYEFLFLGAFTMLF